MGRPTSYRPEFAKQARFLALRGCTLADLAEFFEVGTTTVDNWVKAHPEFKQAIKDGGAVADARVAKALYHRAIGYSHKAVKIMSVAGPPGTGSTIEQVPYIEKYPPDTVACIFWLKNRRPDLWRDKVSVDAPEGAIQFILNMAGDQKASGGKKAKRTEAA